MNHETALALALQSAMERLRSVEQLLLCPTPQAIEEADVLLHEAAGLLARQKIDHGSGQQLAGPNAPETGLEPRMREFRVLCKRVGKLLEGARKVQWIRMRLITSMTQTYTARGEQKMWRPPHGNVNIRM